MAKHGFCAFLVFLEAIFSCRAAFAVQIICETDVRKTQGQLFVQSTNNIYSFSKVDLPSGFRLAGQYLPDINKLKRYVYNFSKERYVLMNAQEYEVSPKTCTQSFGKHWVYGGVMSESCFSSAA